MTRSSITLMCAVLALSTSIINAVPIKLTPLLGAAIVIKTPIAALPIIAVGVEVDVPLNIQASINLVTTFETYHQVAYYPVATPSLLTIGFAHTGIDVLVGLSISLDQANLLLAADLQKCAD